MNLVWKIILLIITCTVWSQDIQFSQFYAVPMYQNPAFAGSAHAPRMMLHNRLQWPGIRSSATAPSLSRYTTSLVSVDHFWAKYRSGAGLMVFKDWQAGSMLASTEVAALYSYEIPVSKSLTIRPGLQASYVSRSVDYSKLRFPENFDDRNGFDGTVASGGAQRRFFDFSTGAVAYTNNLWGGISLHHVNQPNQSVTGGEERLPMKFAVTGGYKIYLKKKNYLPHLEDSKEISLTPTFHYKSQGKADQTDIGVYLIYDQLMAGMWYRGIPFKKYISNLQNNESLVLMAGWKYNNWSAGYSYDFTVSTLATVRTGGSHELNLTYVHHQSKKYKPMKRLPCPSFYKH
ncbi:MAG: type IX secretion system membrane protein PorP/SprF [Cytophagaceae bacterium]|jgi:type IX secretion system PorP/SprF family membrane protein|nr:type IX secretion system membrane protein PorP/SprF [Cytophagaceae bacterium]